MVECRIVPGEDEYELMTAAMMRSMKAVKVQRIAMSIIFMLCCGAAVFSLVSALKGGDQQTFFFLATAAFVCMGVFCVYWAAAGIKKKMMQALRRANQSMDNRERQYIFDNTIRVHSEKADLDIPWEDVQAWGERGRHIYFRTERQFIIVDKNQILRGSEGELRRMMEEHGLSDKKEMLKK